MANNIDNCLLEAIERVCSRAKELEYTTRIWQEKSRLFDLVRYLDEWKQGCQKQQSADKDEPENMPRDYPPDEKFQLEE